jgi:hypothetical protein
MLAAMAAVTRLPTLQRLLKIDIGDSGEGQGRAGREEQRMLIVRLFVTLGIVAVRPRARACLSLTPRGVGLLMASSICSENLLCFTFLSSSTMAAHRETTP